MPGLLDFLDTDEGRLGLGLLAAAGPRGDGMGTGGRIQEAFAGADARKRAQAEAEWKKMQMEDARQQMAQRQQAAAREQQIQGLAQRFQIPGQQGLAPLAGDPGAGILPSQGRAAVPAGFDYQGYAGALAGVDPIKALALQQSLQKQGPKFSTAPQYDQNGRAFILAENGEMKYLDGVKARDKLNEVRLGDKVGFRTDYSPEIQGSLPIGQSPDSKASNAVTMRGQNMTDSRARELAAITAAQGGKPQFHDGQWISPPSAQNPQGMAAPVAGYTKPPGEAQKKQLSGIESLNGAIGEYVTELGSWNKAKMLMPDARASMGTKYNNMMLQAKEAYNLGVLNGPDYSILTSVVADPTDMSSALKSTEAMTKQATELRRIMGITAKAVRGGGAGAEASSGATGGGDTPKIATLSDIQATARASGKSTEEVTRAMRAAGFKIGGQ